jgi:3D (Asp-Asp-Asp) domain-containing protein
MNYNIILSMVMVFLPYEMEREEVRVNKMLETITPEIVTLTTYKANVGETDSTPLITASGFKINESNPRKHRIIAVSRDLKRKYKFGTKLRIKGAGKYDGTYTVRDVMNKRHRNRIDILVGKKDTQTKIKKVKVYKLK